MQEAFQAQMQNDEEMHSMYSTIFYNNVICIIAVLHFLSYSDMLHRTSFCNELEMSVSCVIFYKMFS